MGTGKYSRRLIIRSVIGLAGVAGATSVLAACGQPAAAPSATSAPAAAAVATDTSKPTAAPQAAAAGAAVSIDFWTFADFTTGTSLDLFNLFIKEYEGANAGTKINLIGKPAGDIVSGLVAGAGSGNLPDGVTTQLGVGGQLVAANALKDISGNWSASPASYQKQFSPPVVKVLNQAGKIWGVPFTGYASILYRNLTVLEKAGIDPKAGIKDWDDFLVQAKKVKDSGAFATGKILGDSWAALHYYGGLPGVTNGVTPDGKKTTLDPDKYAQAFEFLLKYQDFSSDVKYGDQAATDLFISNKMAFTSTGPWQDPTLVKAKDASGLKYDYILIPGQSADKKGGVGGGEFVGLMNGKKLDAAWKWTMFLTDVAQLKRFAGGLGRYVANDAALADSEVKKNLLVQTTAEAAKGAVDEGPFFFNTPPQYSQPAGDYGTLVSQKKLAPKEAATKMIAEMNKSLEDTAH